MAMQLLWRVRSQRTGRVDHIHVVGYHSWQALGGPRCNASGNVLRHVEGCEWPKRRLCRRCAQMLAQLKREASATWSE